MDSEETQHAWLDDCIRTWRGCDVCGTPFIRPGEYGRLGLRSPIPPRALDAPGSRAGVVRRRGGA